MSDIFQLLEQRVSAHQFAGSKLSDTELRAMVKAATHSPPRTTFRTGISRLFAPKP